ncbi:MAG: dihydrolipoamide acetyltransferase family protein [Planctomycetota bacterium]|nr:dihydrolipoamide acetyltransferase family protein [Planctomycetota bacterium]
MFEFKLPDIGEGLTEGEVVKWLVAEGDVVADDQPMVEVMTDKATVEITAPCAGTIADIRAEEGEVVPVGNVMVVIDNGKGGPAPKAEAPKAEEAPAPAAPAPEPAAAPAPAPAATAVATAPAPAHGGNGVLRDRTLAAPATRKLARELGIDINTVPATGDHGRVTRSDVEGFAKGGGAGAPTMPTAPVVVPSVAAPRVGVAAPHVPQEDQRIPLRGLRGKIAEQMVRSKQYAPHFTFAEECDMTELVNLRRSAKEAAAAQGVKLTYLPFIMKALVSAFRKFPSVNSLVDDTRNEYVIRGEYNVGIATDTEDGLTVPVVKGIDRLSILQIAAELQRLSEAARTKKLQLADLQGGTFTITSAGSIGGILATPILNYPEVGILGVYKIHEKPVVKDGEIVVRSMCNMTITLDHRIVDGATAARFMNEVVRLLENPGLMLLEGV